MPSALRTVGLVIRWPLSVLFLFLGVVSIATDDGLAGIGVGLIGLALLPPLRQIGKYPLTPWIRTGVIAAGFVLFVIGVPKKELPQVPQPEQSIVEATTTVSSSSAELEQVSSSAQVPLGISVLSITDGDTLTVQMTDGKEEKVRIIGIDAPEKSPAECFAKESSTHLASLLTGKQVVLESEPGDDRDVYGRLLRYIALDGQDIGAAMVRDGYAESYRKYPHPRIDSYNALETQAKQEKNGLWGSCAAQQGTTASKAPAPAPTTSSAQAVIPVAPAGNTNPPQFQEQPPPPKEQECVIKGNVNSDGEKIYHLPGCKSYNVTKIKPEEGDRWFCTEDEARSAGFRKAGNC